MDERNGTGLLICESPHFIISGMRLLLALGPKGSVKQQVQGGVGPYHPVIGEP